MNKIDFPVIPFWGNAEQPKFVERTETQYVKLPHSVLIERGVSSELIEGLIKQLPEGAYVCGGYALSLFSGKNHANDIDIMFTSEQAFITTFNLLQEYSKESLKLKAETNAFNLLEELSKDPERGEGKYKDYKNYTLVTDFEDFKTDTKKHRFVVFTHDAKPKIQLIKLVWYEDGQHIIDTFDLTVTQVAIDKDFVYVNPLTILDLANKKLVLHRMQFPASTLRRIIKYSAKGFYACPGSLVNIATKIMEYEGDMDIATDSQFVYID